MCVTALIRTRLHTSFAGNGPRVWNMLSASFHFVDSYTCFRHLFKPHCLIDSGLQSIVAICLLGSMNKFSYILLSYFMQKNT